jgi:hypothetical protein|tara:strand:+ start:326 stop:712 length:387 start_codon:yes stop_codon:yes gene_type:complete
MKTKKLTFLLALTFLFLFSGFAFGDIVGKKDTNLMIDCVDGVYPDSTYLIDLEEKTIKLFTSDLGTNITYKITETSEMYIKGGNKTHHLSITFWRFVNYEKKVKVTERNMDHPDKFIDRKCFLVGKRF